MLREGKLLPQLPRGRLGWDEPYDEIVRLEIELNLKRCGMEMRLIIPPNSSSHDNSRVVPSLLKAIARAHDWRDKLLNGSVSNQRALAESVGLEQRYVSRILRYAFLAPDIVEAIIDGSQPPDLTLEKTGVSLPLDWAKQRELLGF